MKTQSDEALRSQLAIAEEVMRVIKAEVQRREQIKRDELGLYLKEKDRELEQQMRNIGKLKERLSNDSFIPTFDKRDINYFISTGGWSK